MNELLAIKRRHSSLEGMESTQSTRILSELRSQAHADRGRLLAMLDDCRAERAGLLMELSAAKRELEVLQAS